MARQTPEFFDPAISLGFVNKHPSEKWLNLCFQLHGIPYPAAPTRTQLNGSSCKYWVKQMFQEASFENIIPNYVDRTNAAFIVKLLSMVINGNIRVCIIVGGGSWKVWCCGSNLLNVYSLKYQINSTLMKFGGCISFGRIANTRVGGGTNIRDIKNKIYK